MERVLDPAGLPEGNGDAPVRATTAKTTEDFRNTTTESEDRTAVGQTLALLFEPQAHQCLHGDFWDDDASGTMREAPRKMNRADGVFLERVLDEDQPHEQRLIDKALADFHSRYGQDGRASTA